MGITLSTNQFFNCLQIFAFHINNVNIVANMEEFWSPIASPLHHCTWVWCVSAEMLGLGIKVKQFQFGSICPEDIVPGVLWLVHLFPIFMFF